ncbi:MULTISPECIES: ABC transporter permease [Carboxydocella]|uniref:Transport permease protein n=2 Tax=Carboxydocella TaxID=178898 RepID=A0A1T4PKV1_9FIRM|nr:MULTISPECIES: ABC transporter permease [Carboxydocella]AVX19490.1 ABC-2 type transport system permease protein [Carboxydocella thermautotrophica]AVX29908.1 ABC-2 type transport system permease protein [Carboxydocella thermautotrophica]GAW29031.1 transporter [Carboxydocella sp. ULO1]SJZ92224.1 ABC-2 type transport system permease protein [Carboxydocella sporoproducens DSM 16521]
MSWVRLKAIIWKEFIQISRDRPSLAMIFGVPVMMMLLFGYAISTDVENIATLVCDQSKTRASRELVSAMANTGTFDLRYWTENPGEVRRYLDGGIARVALIIPPDYSKRLARGEMAQVQVLLDGSDPLVARTALSAAQMLAQSLNLNLVTQRLERQGAGPGLNLALDMRTRVWYNPNLESLRFNIPGLMGLVLQNITVILTAFALVRERERGTLEQIIITPIKPVELIIGKLVPYVFIGFFDLLLVLAVAVFWFGVKISGSVALLLALATIFLACALGMGMFVSTVARNQLQAMQMAFLILLPSILLSGFLFPRESMPKIIYWIGQVLPLTYFLQIVRGIVLRGADFSHLWQVSFWLAVLTAIICTLSVLRFRKRLD